MARKTKEEAEQTREAILDAAEIAFKEHGVSHTSLDQVAKLAGCTRGAVYWHFENKPDLFRALMARTESPLFERFDAAVQPEHPDPVERMREATLDSIEDLATNPHSRNMLEILFHRCEFVGDLAPIADQHTSKLHYIIERSSAAFGRGQQQGDIDPDLCPEFCAVMFHTLVTGIIRDWLLAPETIPLRSLCEAMIDHLLGSFGYEPSRARALGMRRQVCSTA